MKSKNKPIIRTASFKKFHVKNTKTINMDLKIRISDEHEVNKIN